MIEMDIVNDPVAFTLAGKEVHLIRLSNIQRRAIAQRWFIGQLVSEIKDKAQVLFPGDEGKQSEYVEKGLAKIPSGQDLQDIVLTSRLTIPLVLEYLKASLVGSMTLLDLEKLVYDSTLEEFQTMLGFLINKKKITIQISEKAWSSVFREIAERTGYTPEQISRLSDEQILAILPDARVTRNSDQEGENFNARVGRATVKWMEKNTGKKPDVFKDIMPMLENDNA